MLHAQSLQVYTEHTWVISGDLGVYMSCPATPTPPPLPTFFLNNPNPAPTVMLLLQVWDEGANRSYWWNAALRESSPVKPLAFEEGFVGMYVWLTRPISGGEIGKGTITR